MCKIIVLLVFSFLLVSSSNEAYYLQAQAEIALLTQPQGQITVRRGARTLRVRESTLLNTDDRVTIGTDGGAVIYQAYAVIDRLNRNDTRTIRILAPPPPRNALEVEHFLVLKRNYLNARNRRVLPSPQTMGGPEDSVLTLWEPRNSVVLESRPTFKWNGVTNATHYTIAVYKGDESPVWTSRVTGTSVTLPESLPRLAPGLYKWEVTAHREGSAPDVSLYDASSFNLLSEEEATRVRSKLEDLRQTTATPEPGTNIVLITALLENKLYSEAHKDLQKALILSPTDQSLWALLMEAYFQMKLWRSRERARETSASLTANPLMLTAFELRR